MYNHNNNISHLSILEYSNYISWGKTRIFSLPARENMIHISLPLAITLTKQNHCFSSHKVQAVTLILL
jgi:hypothetical protein